MILDVESLLKTLKVHKSHAYTQDSVPSGLDDSVTFEYELYYSFGGFTKDLYDGDNDFLDYPPVTSSLDFLLIACDAT